MSRTMIAGERQPRLLTVKPPSTEAHDTRVSGIVARLMFALVDAGWDARALRSELAHLDERLALPQLAAHPKRPAALERRAVMRRRLAVLEQQIRECCQGLGRCWVDWSLEQRRKCLRMGPWPSEEATVAQAERWFREWTVRIYGEMKTGDE